MSKSEYQLTAIREHPEWREQAANWFHGKWNVPLEAYTESMNDCISGNSIIPQWYIVTNNEKIIAGIGVIENDFHNRKDLTPNVCAVYVESEYRCQGIAGKLLSFVCKDMKEKGVETLYLITDHTSFYERYGWEFLCMAQAEGEDKLTRVYIHKER